MINIKDFNSSLLKIDRKPYKNISIYNIGYITIKKTDEYENTNSVNPLYLMIGEEIPHIEEKNKSKYLIFDLTDEIKKILKKIQPTFGWE